MGTRFVLGLTCHVCSSSLPPPFVYPVVVFLHPSSFTENTTTSNSCDLFLESRPIQYAALRHLGSTSPKRFLAIFAALRRSNLLLAHLLSSPRLPDCLKRPTYSHISIPPLQKPSRERGKSQELLLGLVIGSISWATQ